MTTDYAEARQKIEDSDLSPGRKMLALRLLDNRQQREELVEKPVTARRSVPAVPSIPVGWLLASVGASGLIGGLCGALIGGAIWQ